MRTPKKKVVAVRVPRARAGHSRQRQRLIDACISALHIYGPSRTTVEKVVAIAKMSPGIVRFYFASKAAMLVASLQFLSTEFEEQVLVPVARLKSTPVAALELMVDLYLDPDIASPRKVSVWYAFWGEASSRQEYYDICGQKDEGFAALVRELVERLITDTGQLHLEPDGVALGLIGCLEMLWQDVAFQKEGDIDRAAAKRRCMAYLRSVFPGQFNQPRDSDASPGGGRLPGWAYANPRLFALERENVFADAWQFAGHCTQVDAVGDFIAVDLGMERALIVRDVEGTVRGFRNSCSAAPHVLVAAAHGRLQRIRCPIHGLAFELADLMELQVRLVGDLILVRPGGRREGEPVIGDAWSSLSAPLGLRAAGVLSEIAIAADWKLIAEQWLESPPRHRLSEFDQCWSARAYRHVLGSAATLLWQRHFLMPNHLIEQRPDRLTALQVLPSAPGRSVLRQYHFTSCEAARPAVAAHYLAARLSADSRRSSIHMAESTQTGLAAFGRQAADAVVSTPGAVQFREALLSRLPALGRLRPPPDS